ncbi:hypothetical protein F5883DRAFT_224590 [Diaporthe sp. PMI_573]|nr:hypothetical protein F5883DRAFT_224590 [Diaporthaceae sp. PMI_573]
MKYRLKWFYYCVSHGRANETTPRATWAQLLTLLNVDPTNMKPSRRLVDANCIPSSLDVPAQKVKLADLGCFAFCLGFRHVNIDTEARQILATGEIGTITTESMPGFGAVVRLQVSSPRPQHLVVEFSDYEVLFHRGQLLGSFIFNGTFGDETVQYSSLRRKFVNPGAVVDARCPTIAGEVNRWLEITAKDCKHERSEASDTDLCLECLAVWQPLAGGRSWPTILLAASAASIPRLTTGFPSPVFLDPFLRVFQRLAHSLSALRGAIWSQYILENLQEGTMVLELLQHDLCRVTGHEYLTWGHGCEGGHLSWMQNACGLGDIELIEKILLSRMSTRNARTQVNDGEFPRLPRASFVFFQRNQTSGTQAPNTSDPVNAESLTEGRLMPYIVELFDNFDPLP